jgi:hypothetical protein
VTIEVENDTNSSITVHWASSDSRVRVFGVAGTWKDLASGTTTIPAGEERTKAVSLDFSCNSEHQYRLYVTQGGNSWYDTSGWDTGSFIHITV